MDFIRYKNPDQSACAAASRFRGRNGCQEIHIIVRPLEYAAFEIQLNTVLEAYREALASMGLGMESAVWRRFFCSDLLNQAKVLDGNPLCRPDDPGSACGISRVCQPSDGRAKILLWAYHVQDPAKPAVKTWINNTLTLRRNGLGHHWTCGLSAAVGKGSYEQTQEILETYDRILQSSGLSLSDHLVRTWLFVDHMDLNYGGMVRARKEFFARHGLTEKTHYVASTGIEGSGMDPAWQVLMDAYAVSGLRKEQIEFLCAPEYMCPTSRYGVTFERGTCISYRDRRHLFISGTASIDREGRIVHEGDLLRQFERTFENIGALLSKKGASYEDLGVLIVYVRDPADLEKVQDLLQQRFPRIPAQVIHAKVCRPRWLIEAEGIAIVSAQENALPEF